MSARAAMRMQLPLYEQDAVAMLEARRRSAPLLRVVADDNVVVRRARADEVEEIFALQTSFVAMGLLLPRSEQKLRDTIDEYIVATDGDRIVACGALKLYSSELAEVCGLAVAADVQSRGLGRRIVETLVAEAATLGLRRVIALTLRVSFFERLNFVRTEMSTLPEKVAADCAACPKRHACDEIAVVRTIAPTFTGEV